MPRPGWISISLKEDFVKTIKRFIIDNPDLGYVSVSNVIVDALRHLFTELEGSTIDKKEFVELWKSLPQGKLTKAEIQILASNGKLIYDDLKKLNLLIYKEKVK